MTDYTIDDMINQVKGEKALDFKNSFDTLMKDKLQAAINNKKEEIARSMFSDNQEEELESDEVETEVDDESDEGQEEDDLETEQEEQEEEQDNGEES